MNGLRVRAMFWGALLVCGLFGFAATALSAPQTGDVVVIPIHGTVDDGMAHLVARAVAQANDENARAIVLDVNSGGGLVSSAFAIRDALFSAKMPIYAYVSARAYSAAALITLCAQKIVVGPGASIGAAEPIPYSDKFVSALKGEFQSTALHTHHDATLAAEMVDKDLAPTQYKSPGKVLTLDSQDAVGSHLAIGSADTMADAMKQFHLEGATTTVAQMTMGESLVRFATDPAISALLLSIGMLGLLMELQTLHGIAGAIAVIAFALFFGAHIYAGFSNGWIIVLALVGMFGILFELHIVPGHGLPGILGGLFLVAAVILAFGSSNIIVAVETLATALVATVIVFSLLLRAVPENAWMRKMTLTAAQDAAYVTSRDFTDLRGQSGTATSFLRPAGVAQIDGRRIDVLTEGNFIAAGTPIRVTRVEGARIFVEPVTLPNYRSE